MTAAVNWVLTNSGVPPVSLFGGTRGQGTPLAIDTLTGLAYYLSAGGVVSPITPWTVGGTWTPSVGGTATYTTQNGSYIKIGRMVFFTMDLQINVLGTGSPSTITGLPYTPIAIPQSLSICQYTNLALVPVSISAKMNANLSDIVLRGLVAAAASDGILAALGNGSQVIISGAYAVTT